MILRRGCDIDAGNIPETFSSTSIKQTPHDGSSGKVQYLKEKTTSRSCEQTDNGCIDLKQAAIASEVTDNNLQNGENDNNSYSEDSSSSGPTHVLSSLSSSFQPRPTKEPMRNCTALNRSLKEFIVDTVARNLLGFPLKSDKVCDPESVSGDTCPYPVDSSRIHQNQWRRGGIKTANLVSCRIEEVLYTNVVLRLWHCFCKCLGLHFVKFADGGNHAFFCKLA